MRNPGLLWALVASGFGCTADLLPVQVAGPVLRLEATGLPAPLSVIGPADAAGTTEIAAGGNASTTVLLAHDGGVWSPSPLPMGWEGPIRDLTRDPGGALLVVGDGRISRGTLGAWLPIDAPTDRRYIAADAIGRDRYLVAGEGVALMVTSTAATTLEIVASSTATFDAALFDVRARSPSEAYFVGDGGLVLAFDGRRLHRERTDTTDPLRALVGGSGTALYAVGGSTTAVVLTRDARGWSRIPAPNLAALYGADLDADGNLWVGGANGTLARYDGIQWTAIATRLDGQGLRAIYAGPNGVVIGGDSVIARYGR